MFSSRLHLASLFLLAAAVVGRAGGAGAFYDAAYLPVVRTQVNFETDAAGQAVAVQDGTSKAMPADAYLAKGFTFEPAIHWVNPSVNGDFEAAQAVGGSLPIGIPRYDDDEFLITFTTAVRTFGCWVVNNRTAADPNVILTVYGAAGPLAEVRFEGLAIDGREGVADYGFLGYTAAENIVAIHVRKDATLFDNFVFSSLAASLPLADLTGDGQVGLADLGQWAAGWLDADCGRCGGADLNTDGQVDLRDLQVLAGAWQAAP
jgi:hypothetical protein